MKFLKTNFNFYNECKQYGVSLWQCPTFIFILMGIIEIGAMLAVYFLGQKRFGPEIIIPAVFVVAAGIFIPGGIIVRNFERMAEVNKMKTEFVGIVSHQLRSPISAVKWSVAFLKRETTGELTGKQKKYLNLVEENNSRMLVLINDLLSVSRIDQDEVTLKDEKINMEQLISKTADTLRSSAEANNVKLKLRFAKNLPETRSDETYLEIIVTNLIDNAIKYSGPSGGIVYIDTDIVKDKIKVTVRDEGIGISKQDRKFIFGKFYRADNAKILKADGSGLGLYISRSMVKMMGGRMDFKSELGKGSTFWFTLPIKR